MPRAARVVLAGVPHHITQRGNQQQAVFLLEADRPAYLALLKAAEQGGLSILAYCLMTNHIHLVAVPRLASSLARRDTAACPLLLTTR
jgi:putative transposase